MLVHSDLPDLPPTMYQLAKLEILCANIPRAQDIPSQFTTLTALKELDLVYDYEDYWSTTLLAMTQLEKLSVRNNNLKSFELAPNNSLKSLILHVRRNEVQISKNGKKINFTKNFLKILRSHYFRIILRTTTGSLL